MSTLILILLIAALACFLIAAFNLTNRRIHYGWAGLALFALTLVLARL